MSGDTIRSPSVLALHVRLLPLTTHGAALESIRPRSSCQRVRAKPTAGCSSCFATRATVCWCHNQAIHSSNTSRASRRFDAIPYQLRYHGRWDIDFDSVIEAPAHVRALLLVSPNNPTGSYVTRAEAERLAEICRSRGWAIVADEVFVDYPLEVGAAPTESVMDLDVLSFTLGGASKSLGLPQIKLGWIVVEGARKPIAPSPRSRSSLIHSCRLERQFRAQRRPCWLGERRSGTRFVNALLPIWLALEIWRVSGRRARSCRLKVVGPLSRECPRSVRKRRLRSNCSSESRCWCIPGILRLPPRSVHCRQPHSDRRISSRMRLPARCDWLHRRLRRYESTGDNRIFPRNPSLHDARVD